MGKKRNSGKRDVKKPLSELISDLREKVRAAQAEFDMAVAFHEVWKPTAYDAKLHARMGTSYATKAFLVIQVALRREALMALMRLWDNDDRAVGMKRINDALRAGDVFDALVKERATNIGMPDELEAVQRDMDNLQRKSAH